MIDTNVLIRVDLSRHITVTCVVKKALSFKFLKQCHGPATLTMFELWLQFVLSHASFIDTSV